MTVTVNSKTLDKIKKLIALSASPHMEEARSAAMKACTLIRESGLVLGSLDAEATIQRLEFENSQKADWILGLGQAIEQLRAQLDVARAGGAKALGDGGGPRFMTSKYHGRCVYCGRAYSVGSEVYWKKGVGCWHPRCWKLTQKEDATTGVMTE